MIAYEFTFTPRFQKHFKELTTQEKKRLKSKLELLAENPSHPSLRTKRIQGTTDLFECSVNMDIRIIWYYEGKKMIILLLQYYSAIGIPEKEVSFLALTKQNVENFLCGWNQKKEMQHLHGTNVWRQSILFVNMSFIKSRDTMKPVPVYYQYL